MTFYNTLRQTAISGNKIFPHVSMMATAHVATQTIKVSILMATSLLHLIVKVDAKCLTSIPNPSGYVPTQNVWCTIECGCDRTESFESCSKTWEKPVGAHLPHYFIEIHSVVCWEMWWCSHQGCVSAARRPLPSLQQLALILGALPGGSGWQQQVT